MSRERECEALVVSVLVINLLHDARILDPYNSWDAYLEAWSRPHEILDTHIDGEIPVRIELRHDRFGPALIEWRLWPDEPGRATWGMVALHRLPGKPLSCFLTGGAYERSRKRSDRLRRIPVPDAKWGLRSTAFERFEIATTY